MNSSMRYWRARSPQAAAVSGSARMARSLPCAATNDCTLSARMTPRDAESRTGLSTHGNVMAFAMVAGSSSRLRNMKRGTGTPALASNSRCRYLSLAAIAACTGFPFSFSLVVMAAAITAVASSTATTPLIGYCLAKTCTASAARSGCSKSRVRRPAGFDSSSALGRSDATVNSTPICRAASTNAAVRYVVVGNSSSSRGGEDVISSRLGSRGSRPRCDP